MNFNERLDFYTRNYDLVSSYQLGKGKKKHIGKKGDNCRFCGKNEPEVSFKTIAHAVPEFLGNKQLILKNECDDCNEFFSNVLENHLDKFTKPYRISAQIKGKKKVPSHKSRDKKTRFDFKPNSHSTIISPAEGGYSNIDHDKKEITYNFELEPYLPAAVYKCLVKIALSILEPGQVKNFNSTIQWIKDKDHSKKFLNPLRMLRTFIPGPKPINELIVQLFQKKDLVSTRPHFILVLGFGNQFYQIIIPSDLDVLLSGTKSEDIFYPLPFEINWPYGKLHTQVSDLSGIDVVDKKIETIVYSFESIREAPEYKGKTFEELGIKYS